jgi:hypothetical protein
MKSCSSVGRANTAWCVLKLPTASWWEAGHGKGQETTWQATGAAG